MELHDTERHVVDLTVGEVVRIGDIQITVVDVDKDEVTFRIEEPLAEGAYFEESSPQRPR